MSYISDLLYSVTSCLTCFQSPSLRIGRNNYVILKLLGEGGFSYVYLVENIRTHERYALKKIRCAFGQESVQVAMKEIDAYKLFRSDYVIRALDYAVQQDPSEGTKVVYIVLPYYQKGNLQDKIDDNLISGVTWDEGELLSLFTEICRAISVIHKHRADTKGAQSHSQRHRQGHSKKHSLKHSQGRRARSDERERFMEGSLEDAIEDAEASTIGAGGEHHAGDADDTEEGQRLLSRSLELDRDMDMDLDLDEIDDLDMDNMDDMDGAVGMTELVPYAHRDIKPANIMLDDHNKPVLMDLGSCQLARVHVRSRQQALRLQDDAAEHCTLPYRAPELFDIRSFTDIDERVDIWSLGCTLFCLMYYSSPFEMATAESGASLNLAIAQGQFKFPARPDYSQGLKAIVTRCLTVDPKKRPYIDEVLDMALELQERSQYGPAGL